MPPYSYAVYHTPCYCQDENPPAASHHSSYPHARAARAYASQENRRRALESRRKPGYDLIEERAICPASMPGVLLCASTRPDGPPPRVTASGPVRAPSPPTGREAVFHVHAPLGDPLAQRAAKHPQPPAITERAAAMAAIDARPADGPKKTWNFGKKRLTKRSSAVYWA